jgi:hypothetical protein
MRDRKKEKDQVWNFRKLRMLQTLARTLSNYQVIFYIPHGNELISHADHGSVA